MYEVSMVTTPIVVKNEELNLRLETIRTCLNEGMKLTNQIGQALSEIKDKELWKEDFDKFEDCCAVFKIKRAQAYNLIKGYKALNTLGITEDYNNTQGLQIAKLINEKGEKVARKMIEDGKIKSTMSVEDIKAVVDKKIGKKKEDKKDSKTETAEAVEVNTILAIMYDGKDYTINTGFELSDDDKKALIKIVNKYTAE